MVKVNQIAKSNVVSPNKWLFILLFITLVSTAWTALHGDGTSDDATVEPAEKKTTSELQQTVARSPSSGQLKQHLEAKNSEILSSSGNLIPWQKLQREPLQSKTYDVFKVHSWLVIPPVKKLKPQPPPLPVAPPAPFTYVGKLENSPRGTLIFLMANNKLYSVAKGEKIDQQWKFEAEDANTLRLTFGPLNLVQILSKSAKPALSSPVAAVEINQ